VDALKRISGIVSPGRRTHFQTAQWEADEIAIAEFPELSWNEILEEERKVGI